MKTKNSIQWYVNGDNNIMIATNSFVCCDGTTDVTYTAMTSDDLLKMLENMGAVVKRKPGKVTVTIRE